MTANDIRSDHRRVRIGCAGTFELRAASDGDIDDNERYQHRRNGNRSNINVHNIK